MYHSEEPKQTAKTFGVLIWGLLAGGLILFVGASYLPALTALPQLLGVGMMVAAISLVGRYQTHYIYRTEPDSRGGTGTDFVIIQRKGRRETAVCRLDMADVRAVERQTSENRETLKKKYAEMGKVHDFCVDLAPADCVYVVFEDAGETVILRLQASAALVALFEAARSN